MSIDEVVKFVLKNYPEKDWHSEIKKRYSGEGTEQQNDAVIYTRIEIYSDGDIITIDGD